MDGNGVGWGEMFCVRVLNGIDLGPRGFIHLGGWKESQSKKRANKQARTHDPTDCHRGFSFHFALLPLPVPAQNIYRSPLSRDDDAKSIFKAHQDPQRV